ncbi:MAG: FAD-binding oxidoreductase [Chloroflexi bacterium]|nr:FAD-binding oxidoreductase [Chloroflexota bacterium]
MTVFADVVIVGAGVMGCSTAFQLARRNGPRVIVVEKGAIASGQTKRSGALIRTHYPFEPEARLALASLHTFQNWKDAVGGTCGFAQTGLAWLVGGQAHALELRREVESLQAIGVNTQLVSPEELPKLQPGVRVDDVSLAAFEPESGYADPVATTQALAERARAFGVVFKTGTWLRSIRVTNGRVSGVDTTVGPIETLSVVVAAGPWSDAFLKPLGIETGIRSVRAQVAFYDRPAELKPGHAAFVDNITGVHFRPHPFGLTMGGYNDPSTEELKNPDRLEESISNETVADLQRRIATRLPAMASARFTRGHAGVYDMSPDGRAILGRVPGIHGLYVGAGFSGNGFALAPAAGACIAELVADGEATTANLDPFKIERFRVE